LTEMFSNKGFAPNCIVIFAAESTLFACKSVRGRKSSILTNQGQLARESIAINELGAICLQNKGV
jgi:hypothetical protein